MPPKKDYPFNKWLVTSLFGLPTVKRSLIVGRNGSGKSLLGKALFDIKSLLYDSPRMYTPNFPCRYSYTFLIDRKIVKYEYVRHSEGYLVVESLKETPCDILDKDRTIFHLRSPRQHENMLKALAAIYDGQEKNFAGATVSLKDSGEPQTGKISNEELILAQCIDSFVKRMLHVQAGADISEPDIKNLTDLYDHECGIVAGRYFSKMDMYLKEHFRDSCNWLSRRRMYYEVIKNAGSSEAMTPPKLPCSSGKRNLLNIIRGFLHVKNNSAFVFLDNFDSNLDVFTLDDVMEGIKVLGIDGQLALVGNSPCIISNRFFRPDCIMMVENGCSKPIYSVTDRELREGHDLSHLWVAGEFAL